QHDVLGCHLALYFGRQPATPVMVAQRHRHHALGLALPNNVAVELCHDLYRGHLRVAHHELRAHSSPSVGPAWVSVPGSAGGSSPSFSRGWSAGSSSDASADAPTDASSASPAAASSWLPTVSTVGLPLV